MHSLFFTNLRQGIFKRGILLFFDTTIERTTNKTILFPPIIKQNTSTELLLS